MDRKDMAHTLKRVSDLLEVLGDEPHRARAYANAARRLERYDGDIAELARKNGLTSLKGIGRGMATAIEEMLETGRLSYLDDLEGMLPPGLAELLEVRGLGPKKLRSMHLQLGISSVSDLETACRSGKLASVKGFGKKSQESLLQEIKALKQRRGKHLLPMAMDVAHLVSYGLVERLPDLEVFIAGSVRRRLPLVTGIVLVVSGRNESEVISAVDDMESLSDVRLNTGVVRARHELGPDVEIRITTKERAGTALFEATGCKEHTKKIWERLGNSNDRDFTEENEIYKAAGLDFVRPELREDTGEIEAAANRSLPPGLARTDVLGILHVHTNWSDGVATLEEMAAEAKALGYSYLGICDHSQSARYAGGLTPSRLKEQRLAIEATDLPVPVVQGVEADILPDGRLDYEPEVLDGLDFVVASVHSSMGQDRQTMTKRLVRAVENPYTDILGHPSGRLLLVRDAYQVDMEQVLRAAARTGTAVELNANPHRLDLDWKWVRRAVELGVMIAVNPDAHRVSDMQYVEIGIDQANKGWLTKDLLLNAMPLERFKAWIENRRRRRHGGP